jgi:elongation factor G
MEVEVATKVIDGCVLILDAVSGVQCQTKTVWKKISHRNLPAIAFINKMDRDGADFYQALTSIEQQLHVPALALHFPIYEEINKKTQFVGFIDLISEQSFLWPEKAVGNGNEKNIEPNVEKLASNSSFYEPMKEQKLKLVEQIAEHDEIFADYYLENMETLQVTDNKELNQLMLQSLQRITKERKVIPAFCGSALKGKGIHHLLDGILYFLPNPDEISPRKLIPSEPSSNSGKSNKSRKAAAAKEKLPILFQDLSSKGKEEEEDDEPLLGQIFKVIHEPMKGFMLFIRLFSGTLSSKQLIYNTNKRKDERVFHLLEIASNEYTPINSITKGEIACIQGNKNIISRIGDTIIDSSNKKWKDYCLEGMIIPRPVFSQVIECKKSSDHLDLDKILSILAMEDPSLMFENDAETGQTILYGLGELHLEIICDKILRQHNMPIIKGKTSIHYRESLSPNYDGSEVDWVYDRTIDGKHLFAKMKLEFTSTFSSLVDSIVKNNKKGNNNNGEEDEDSHAVFASSNQYPSPTFVITPEVESKLSAEEFDTLNDALETSLSQGPRGYPMVGLQVTVKDLQKETGSTTTGAIRACVATGISSFLRQENHEQFLEPMMSIEIEVPNDFLGEVVSDLTSKRRALNLEIRPLQQGNHSIITAVVPLQTLLGYVTHLRSITHGEGIFSSEYLCHAPVENCFVQN